MQRISNNQKCMASLAVFRKLYDCKKDIYSVISEYLNQIFVHDYTQEQITLQQLMQRVKDKFGFIIPESVLKNASRRLKYAKPTKGIIKLNRSLISKSDNLVDIDESAQKSNQLIQQLIEYVESKIGKQLSDSEKLECTKSFCSYIVEDSTNISYKEYILSYILSKNKDQSFMDQIETIREGVIYFIGLSYQTNDNSIDILDKPLTIYLDTEIIFHIWGLNGELYKKMALDFLDLVKQVNKKSKNKNIISLKFTKHVKDEINSFFDAAELIVRHNTIRNNGETAMFNLIDGCSMASDVASRRTILWGELDIHSIIFDTNSIDCYSDYELVIEHNKYLSNFEDTSEEKIYSVLESLQFIKYKRGRIEQKYFRGIEAILLTGKKLTIAIANDSDIKGTDQVPLATTLSFLTNRLWISLNKSLGNMDLVSFNVIVQTQLVFSKLINDKICKEYTLLNEQLKKGLISNEKAVKIITYLRSQQIDIDNEIKHFEDDGYLSFLSENDYIKKLAESENELDIVKTNEQRKRRTILVKRQSELNNEAQKEYHIQLNDYKENTRKYIKNKLRKLCRTCVLCHIIPIAIGFFSIFSEWILTNLKYGIGLLCIAFTIYEYLKQYKDKYSLREQMSIIFSRKKRKTFLLHSIREYYNTNSHPLIKVWSIDDVERLYSE